MWGPQQACDIGGVPRRPGFDAHERAVGVFNCRPHVRCSPSGAWGAWGDLTPFTAGHARPPTALKHAHILCTQLSYVGHSQGGGLLLMLLSRKPEYNDRISVGVNLAPVASIPVAMHNYQLCSLIAAVYKSVCFDLHVPYLLL